jgi:phosphatidylserine/phosphatidylglycerophosphate/cardiolipin synthase-like enzyme
MEEELGQARDRRLVSRDTGVVVRELFSAAERSVLAAGYAVYPGRDVFRALAERAEAGPDLHVRMFLDIQRPYTDTTRDADLVRRFRSQEWPGARLPEVYCDPRSLHVDRAFRASLHARCVVVDERVAFVSPANFTPAAQVKNIEAGVLVRSERVASQPARALSGAGEQRRTPAGAGTVIRPGSQRRAHTDADFLPR